jgi:hypothetical protein
MSEQEAEKIVSLDNLFGMECQTLESKCDCGGRDVVLKEVICSRSIRIEVRCRGCLALRSHLSRGVAFAFIRKLRAERPRVRRCQPVDAA